MVIARRVVGVCALALLLVPAVATAQALAPTLTYPADGAVNANMSQPITWTSVANVQMYYLYVGTTVGAKNLVDTGGLQTTSYQASGLPSGQTLYARVWAEVGGIWRYTDSTFTAAASVVLAPTLTYPANGAVNANMSQPITWTTVANAQAYYLYVGTTVGTKNLIDTGGLQTTSYQASGLPSGQTLYARVWAEVGGIWRYTDSTFTAAASAPLAPTLTYPANGAVNANMSQPITWTTVANAQAYYLYVGTTAGAKNVVDTGGLQATSYQAAGLPSGVTLYARVWAQVSGIWRYTDSTFTAAASGPLAPTLTYPVNGAVNANLLQPITWTTVANAQAYYLYVGTTVGAKNLVDTGGLQTTSYLASNLPSGQTLYARVWAEVAGIWRYTDSTFTAVSLVSTLIFPANGAVNVDQTTPASWTTVPNVEWYYLYVGTTPGAKDVIDSHGLTTTSFPISYIPAGQTLYARLWTAVGGIWRFKDSTFSAAPMVPTFVYPTDGALGVTAAQPFQWTPPANASSHRLIVGTSPGGADVFDSGSIGVTSVTVPTLPATGALYARVLSYVNGRWVYSDAGFTVDAAVPASTIVLPANGALAFDSARPFTWADVPLARAYRLRIGTTPGASDVHDSGEIHVTQRFVPNLPLGLLYGRVETKINGQWSSTDFTFTATANTLSPVFQSKAAFWATDFVRGMSLTDNLPFSWTPLASTVVTRHAFAANCVDYAVTLIRLLAEVNIQESYRRLDISMDQDDQHTLVEMLDAASGTWLILDPTFDLTVTRASDGAWASAEDISASALSQQWNDVSYTFLGASGDVYVRGYYLDYPLLFLNVFHEGTWWPPAAPAAVLPYMEPVSMPMTPQQGVYAVACSGTTVLSIDHVDTAVACDGVDGMSNDIVAGLIEFTSQTGDGVTVYRPRRYVF